jgi:hypothetical protein
VLIARLDLSRAEASVVSACVQMPSLAAVQVAQDLTGLPTLSAATATTRSPAGGSRADPGHSRHRRPSLPADLSPSEPLTVRWASPCGSLVP